MQKDYKSFRGSYQAKMEELVASSLRPINLLDVMKKRLEGYSLTSGDRPVTYKVKEIIDFWNYHRFSTVDGVALNDNKFKVVHDAQQLIDIKPNTQFKKGFLVLASGQYEALEVPEFVKVGYNDVEYAVLVDKAKTNRNYRIEELYELGATPINKGLEIVKVGGKKINEVENSDLWLTLAHGDPRKNLDDEINQAATKLRNEYQKVFFEGKKQDDNGAMGVYLLDAQSEPTIRPWSIASVSEESNAWGRLLGNVQLVGLHTEGELDNLVETYTPQDIIKAKNELKRLKKIVKDENLSSLEDLLSKL